MASKKTFDKTSADWLELKLKYDELSLELNENMNKLRLKFEKKNSKLMKQIEKKDNKLKEMFKEFKVKEKIIDGYIIKATTIKGTPAYSQILFKILDEVNEKLKNKYEKMIKKQKKAKNWLRLSYKAEESFIDFAKDLWSKFSSWLDDLSGDIFGAKGDLQIAINKMSKIQESYNFKNKLRKNIFNEEIN